MTDTATMTMPTVESQAAPLTVLQVGMGWLPWHGGGGVERYLHGLVNALPQVSVKPVTIVVDSPPAGCAAEDVETPIISAAPNGTSLPRRYFGVRRQVQQFLENDSSGKPDLITSHFALYGAAARSAIRRLRRHTPHVVHFHGPWAAESAVEGAGFLAVAAKRHLESRVYQSARLVLTASRAFAELLTRDYRVSPERVRVVGAGVDTERFKITSSRQEAREQLGWPTDRPILLAVRRLVRRMGLENLLEAVQAVTGRVADILLLIVGTGPLHAELQERINRLGLKKQVRLVGYVPESDLLLAYRAADLSILPSASLEGFGLAAAESLACGTPVLVTPIGGLPEVVGSLCTDLICEAESPRAMASRIAGVMNQEVFVPNAAACRRHAEVKLSWSAVAARVRTAYDAARYGKN